MSRHAARLSTSVRLQRVYAALADGCEHSTRELIEAARVCAINSVIYELRENGCVIRCRRAQTASGPIWLYRMEVGQADAPAWAS